MRPLFVRSRASGGDCAGRLLVTLVVALAGLAAAPAARAAVLVADAGGNGQGDPGALLRVPAGGGAASVLAQGGEVEDPVAVASGGSATYVLRLGRKDGVDTPALLRLDPSSGAVAVIESGAPLERPLGLAVAADGIVWIGDGDRLLRVDVAGRAVAVVLSGEPLRQVTGLAVASDGRILIADAVQGALLAHTPGSRRVDAVAAVAGVRGVAVDGGGRVLVTDQSPAVRRVDPGTGAVTPVVSGAPLVAPHGLAVAADGSLLVADPGAGAVLRVAPGASAAAVFASGEPVRGPFDVEIGPPEAAQAPAGSAAPAPAAAAVPDRSAPVLTTPRLRPDDIVPARSGPSILGPAGTVRSGALLAGTLARATALPGADLQFRVSEPGRARLTLQKRRHLSRVCRRRVSTARHRSGTRCRRWVWLKGNAVAVTRTGVNTLRFTGRWNGRRLGIGFYRLWVRAFDLAGNRSPHRRTRFHVVRR